MKTITGICSGIAAICTLLVYAIPDKVNATQNDLIYGSFLTIMFFLMFIHYEIKNKQ